MADTAGERSSAKEKAGEDRSLVSVDVRDAVATVTLNRPDKLNAINMAMHRELMAVLKQLKRDREVRVLVLTGEGRAFCVGQDLAEFLQLGEGFRVDDHVRTTYNRLITALRELDQPVIGAINGIAAGAGASLALATDMRIVSENASFLQAFVRIGLLPDSGGTWFLPHLVGTARALELAWTGRPADAAEAERIGIANRVVAPEQLLSAAHEQASQLARMPARALALTKRAVYRSVTEPLSSALEYEAQLQQHLVSTEDHREGVAAFMEKREPEFVGR